MEISSESQNDLIEKYVSGAMSSDEALEFETFILTKPDWLQKVDRARVLFEQVYEQEWQSELENTLAERKANKGSFNDKLANLLGAWFTPIFKPAIAMAMGALIMFTLVPEQAIDNQPIGKIYSGSFGVDRGIGSFSKPIELPIDSDVDHLALKLSSGNELNRVFKIRASIGSNVFERDGYKPDDHGMVLFSLAGDFNNDELITITLLSQDNGDVFKEYMFVIKEN